VQPEEEAVMLKEFNHIARQMLFMHGHLTRPEDWAEKPAFDTPESRRSGGSKPAWHRFATALVAIPTSTNVLGQIR
jgi:hypothetical protein